MEKIFSDYKILSEYTLKVINDNKFFESKKISSIEWKSEESENIKELKRIECTEGQLLGIISYLDQEQIHLLKLLPEINHLCKEPKVMLFDFWDTTITNIENEDFKYYKDHFIFSNYFIKNTNTENNMLKDRIEFYGYSENLLNSFTISVYNSLVLLSKLFSEYQLDLYNSERNRNFFYTHEFSFAQGKVFKIKAGLLSVKKNNHFPNYLYVSKFVLTDNKLSYEKEGLFKLINVGVYDRMVSLKYKNS